MIVSLADKLLIDAILLIVGCSLLVRGWRGTQVPGAVCERDVAIAPRTPKRRWGVLLTAAIVLAVLQLLGFPIGTIIGIITLWYLLADDDAKAAFQAA